MSVVPQVKVMLASVVLETLPSPVSVHPLKLYPLLTVNSTLTLAPNLMSVITKSALIDVFPATSS